LQRNITINPHRAGYSRFRAFCLPGILILAGVAAYSNSLRGPFIFDDALGIVENKSIRSLGRIGEVLSPPREATVAARPILNLSFALNYAGHGLRVEGYHLTNIAIHLAGGLFLFGVIRRSLLLPQFRERFGRAAGAVAFWSALFWIVHPLQTQSVSYIVQRAESLAGLFVLATLYSFIRGADTGKRGWFVFAVIACALGMGTKETVAVAPLLVLLYDRCFIAGSFKRSLRRRGVVHLALFVTNLIFLYLLLYGPRRVFVEGSAESIPPLRYALTQCEVVAHYLFLAFWPESLCLDYHWDAVSSINQVVLPLSLICALLLTTALALWLRPPLGFSGAWFFVILAPTSSFFPVTDPAFEQRMYLPLAAITTLVVVLVHHLLTRVRLVEPEIRRGIHASVIVVAVGTAVLCTLRTRSRNMIYASEVGIWQDVISKRPENPRAHVSLGHAYHRQGNIQLAEQVLRRALELKPDFAQAHFNLSVLLAGRNEMTEALSHAVTATQLAPQEAEHQFNLGRLRVRMEHWKEAESAYFQAIDLRSDYPEAWYNLGNLAMRAGDYSTAEQRFRRALKSDEQFVDARINLAAVLNQTGRVDSAKTMLEEAGRIADERARIQRTAGRDSETAEMQARVVQIRPADRAERLQYARDLAAAGRFSEAIRQCEILTAGPQPPSEAAALLETLRQSGRR